MSKNFAHLIKDEIVKRFSSVVSEEVRQHNLAIERSNANIKSMQAELDQYKIQIKKLYDQNIKMHAETRCEFIKEKDSLESVFSSQQEFVNNISAKIENHVINFISESGSLFKKSDHEDSRDDILNKIHNLSLQIQQVKKDFEDQIAKSAFENRKNIDEYSSDFKIILSDLNKSLSSLSAIVSTDKIDSVGVLRELQIHKKSVLIVEKKIENLYGITERLSKRVEK